MVTKISNSKIRSIFFKEGNSIFSIKLGRRLPKSFSQLPVKNSRFFLSYFSEKNYWPKAYAGSRLRLSPTAVIKKKKNGHAKFLYASHLSVRTWLK